MRVANFDHPERRRCEDIKGIAAPETGAKRFGIFEKQAPELSAVKKRILRLSIFRYTSKPEMRLFIL